MHCQADSGILPMSSCMVSGPDQSSVVQVLDTCLAADIPVAGYVGGGYSPDLRVLARRHCQLHRAAKEMWDSYALASLP